MNLTSRTCIGKYEIISRLGAGGMGSVHLAHDPSLDREVAIKVLRAAVADEELRVRFLREARATANLHHANIITIYEVGEHDQQPFIAMEYVAGHALATVIAEQRPLPLPTKLYYLEQLCAGLDFAHRAGIVHRDVKPANVMVDAQDVIRILDFGIARLSGSGMTMDGALMGTINYMSPEQMLGRRVDHRSDIFAVGAVAYELISYCQAFPGTLEELLRRLPNDPPMPLASLCPDIDPDLEAIVMRALEKDPSRRFGDLSEMQAALAVVRQRIEIERGAGFMIATPAAASTYAATRLVRPANPRLAEDVKAQLHAASKCLDTGDPARAVDLAQRVIARVPSSVEAHALLIRAHRALAGHPVRGGNSSRGTTPVPNRKRQIALVAGGVALPALLAIVLTTSDVWVDRDTPPTVATTPTPRPERPPAAVPADPRSAPVSSPDEHAAPHVPARDIRAEAERNPVEERRATESRPDVEAGTRATAIPPEIVAPPPVDTGPPAVAPAPIDIPDPSPPPAVPPAVPPSPSTESGGGAAPVNPIVRERPGILAALQQYQAAYRSKDIDALKAVYPNLKGEALQAKAKFFKDKRTCPGLDVTFAEPVISLTADATVAHVKVLATYICIPATGQPKPHAPNTDVFEMHKNAGGWIISVMGAMGS